MMRLVSGALVVCIAAACAGRGASVGDAAAIEVRITEGAITMPDSVPAGWQRLRVVEDSVGHIVVFWRLDGADSLAIGGAEVGDSSEVVLELSSGRYRVTCTRRHAGERREFTVTGSGAAVAEAPQADVSMAMHDFAYTGEERWTAGRKLVRVTNDGQEDHQVRMARLLEGVTLRRWLEDTSGVPLDSTMAGMARVGRGGTAYFEAEVRPGRYVVYCLVPTADGEPHAVRGMFREIVVE